MLRIGFVGTGAITSAIVTGLCSPQAEVCRILVSPRNIHRATELARRFSQVSIASSNQAVLDESEVVVLAVRPDVAREVIANLQFGPGHRVVSVIARTPLRLLSDWVNSSGSVTRAVPLPSVALRRGVTALYPPDPVVAALFSTLGSAIEVTREGEFDAFCTATATIASVFAFADSLASWLTAHGIERRSARDYAAHMISEVGESLLDAPERSIHAHIGEYATAGGINEQFLSHLREHGVFETVSEGMDSVLRRFEAGEQQGAS